MLWQPIPPGIALVTSRAVAGLDWHVRASCQPRWAVGARSTSSWSGFCAILSSSVKTPANPPHPLPPPPPPPFPLPHSSTYFHYVCLIRVVVPLPLVTSLFFFFQFGARLFCIFWPQLSTCTQTSSSGSKVGNVVVVCFLFYFIFWCASVCEALLKHQQRNSGIIISAGFWTVRPVYSLFPCFLLIIPL